MEAAVHLATVMMEGSTSNFPIFSPYFPHTFFSYFFPPPSTIEAAVHLATVMMEGSSPLQQRVLNFVYEHYPNGQQVFEMAKCIAACIREEDLELQVCTLYM